MALLVLFYVPTMFAPEGKVLVAVMSILSLSFYIVFAALVWWVERKSTKN